MRPQMEIIPPLLRCTESGGKGKLDSGDWSVHCAAVRRYSPIVQLPAETLTGTLVGFKLRGLQDNASGACHANIYTTWRRGPTPRDRSSRPGLIHRAFETSDQVGGGESRNYLTDSGYSGRGAR
jgi:hypothetical protein